MWAPYSQREQPPSSDDSAIKWNFPIERQELLLEPRVRGVACALALRLTVGLLDWRLETGLTTLP